MKTIPLTQGQVALVDDADYEAVSQFKWCAVKARKGYYARRRKGRKQIYLHKFLLPEATYVDHKDGNRLDCRRQNMRSCTHSQNQRASRTKKPGATSQYRGVSWYTKQRKWAAKIYVEGKHLHLGMFSDEKDAARAYDVAARKYFGEFASPNFP